MLVGFQQEKLMGMHGSGQELHVCVLQLGTHSKTTLWNDSKKALTRLARPSNSHTFGRPNCAAITVTEPDFSAEYDKITQRWTASWKWVGDQPPVTLRNRLAEYPAPAQI